jgi:uncharacterized protein (DUF2141 family)
MFSTSELLSQTVKKTGTLVFNVNGLEDNSGQVFVQLFRKNDDIPSSPYKKVTAKIVNQKAVVKITNLDYGDYAAMIVHDQNFDGEIEHCMGIPCEPLGFTNNWELTLVSGMPTFDKLKFTFSQSKCQISINMEE